MSSWRPLFTFRYDAIRKMGAYGSRLVASNIISTLFENINQLLIGKFYTAPDLGFYNRAQTMQSIPVNTFSQAVSGVLLPAFVHLNDKPYEFRKGYRNAIRCSMAVSVPMMAILGLLAKPIFLLLLSEKWLPAVPYFQIFCLSGTLYPLHLLNINTLLALGKPNLYFKVEVIKRVISLCGAFVALPFGVMAFAQSTVVISAICLVINTHYTHRILKYGIINQILDTLPFIASALISIGLTWAVLQQIQTNAYIQIAVGSLIAIPVYLTASWLIARDTCQFIIRAVRHS
jgi:O-antigen/teichoic acid export membrane protein